MSWIQHESTTDLELRRGAVQRGIEGGWLSMCRRESDMETVREIDQELERRGRPMTDTQTTDPATDLALFADGLEFAGVTVQPPLVANIRAVLERLDRAESIAKAATALDAVLLDAVRGLSVGYAAADAKAEVERVEALANAWYREVVRLRVALTGGEQS